MNRNGKFYRLFCSILQISESAIVFPVKAKAKDTKSEILPNTFSLYRGRSEPLLFTEARGDLQLPQQSTSSSGSYS